MRPSNCKTVLYQELQKQITKRNGIISEVFVECEIGSRLSSHIDFEKILKEELQNS